MPDDRLVGGVDGCRGGWIAAIGRVDASLVFLAAADRLDSLFDRFRRTLRWAVDMPIGLCAEGRRDCDQIARRRLGSRSSTIFSAPPRSVLGAADYADACRLAQAATGKKLSQQSWNLVPKIREVRAALIDRPRLRGRVFESHPELCFACMNGGGALTHGKKTTPGQAERIALLAQHVEPPMLEGLLAEADAMSGVARDDALDALACWNAGRRSLLQLIETAPQPAPFDGDGLPLAISW